MYSQYHCESLELKTPVMHSSLCARMEGGGILLWKESDEANYGAISLLAVHLAEVNICSNIIQWTSAYLTFYYFTTRWGFFPPFPHGTTLLPVHPGVFSLARNILGCMHLMLQFVVFATMPRVEQLPKYLCPHIAGRSRYKPRNL